MKRRSLVGSALAAAAAAAATGCSIGHDFDHRGPHAPRAGALPRRVRTAWVFGSGGPRGFVHVGVLRALSELRLAPDLVVGSSVGAVVAALYAAGRGVAEIESIALSLNPMALLRLALGAEERLSGAPLREVLQQELPVHLIEQMPVALAIVAMRQPDRVPVAFTAGDAALAVQASAAIESRFAPVRIVGTRYLDADAVLPLPVRAARALGAMRVLAVDASVHLDRVPPGAERYREGDLRKAAAIAPDAAAADVVLKPDFGYWVSFSREFRERAIDAGYRETMAQSARLQQMHAG